MVYAPWIRWIIHEKGQHYYDLLSLCPSVLSFSGASQPGNNLKRLYFEFLNDLSAVEEKLSAEHAIKEQEYSDNQWYKEVRAESTINKKKPTQGTENYPH